MKRPNFFIVGEPKSGTTTLYRLLKVHPDIFMPEEKEPSYFCPDFIRESIDFYGRNVFFHYTDEASYLKIFAPAQTQTAVGEATTRYLYSKVSAKEIHGFDPHAKIIMMFREPVDFLYSLHSQYLCNPFEDIDDFEKALSLEQARKRGEHIPKMVKCPSLLFYRERAKYAEHAKRFLDTFPRNQIHVVLFDDLQKDIRKVYKDVLMFLGVDPQFEPDFSIANPNTAPVMRSVFYKLHTPALKMFFWNILPQRIFIKIRSFLEKCFLKPVTRPPLDDHLRQKMKKELYPEVRAINDLLRREQFITDDLIKLWNYGA